MNQGFANFENETELIKKSFLKFERQTLEVTTAATLTLPMLEELEPMRKRTVHEQAVNALSSFRAPATSRC